MTEKTTKQRYEKLIKLAAHVGEAAKALDEAWQLANDADLVEGTLDDLNSRVLTTQRDALKLAHELAVTASTKDKAREATALAEEIARGMAPEEVAEVQREIEAD